MKLILNYVLINFILNKIDVKAKENHFNQENGQYKDLDDHTMVTDSNVFPYTVAILKKTRYLSAGALIDNMWVLTAADSLFLLRDSLRLLHVRLGSINYKKGGILLPIKSFEIHPYFDDSKPEFDIALVRLPQTVIFTPNLNPIRLQKKSRRVTATHFIVTSWLNPPSANSDEPQRLESMEVIKRRRMLSLWHLHPMDQGKCLENLDFLGVNRTETLMCLDPALGSDPCVRDIGAPVVLNGILWGVVSSWKPEDCDVESSPSFVTLVSAKDVGSWIHSTVHGHKWIKSKLTHNFTRII